MKPKITQKAILFVIGTGLTTSGFAVAAESENVANAEQKVETPSRIVEKLSDAPATVAVITKQQIQDRHYVNLNDLLMDLPSVTVSRLSDPETQSTISIRGNPGNNKFIVMVNGIRMTPNTGEPFVVEDNYPLFNAKQVEIIYGPASALYGADAFSGIINILTESEGNQVGATIGSYSYNNQYASTNTKVTDNLKLNLTFYRSSSNNPDLSSAYPNDMALGQQLLSPTSSTSLGASTGNARSDQFSQNTSSLNFSATAKIDEKFKVGFDQRSYNHRSSTGVMPEYQNFGPYDMKSRQRTFFMKYGTNLSSSVNMDSSIRYQISDLLPDSTFNNAYSGYSSAYKYASNSAMLFDQKFGFDLAENHNFMVGFQYILFHSNPYTADLSQQLDPDKPAAIQGLTYPVNSGLPIQFYDLDYRRTGGFAQLRSVWSALFSTTFGIRYDNDSRFGGTINPRAAGVFHVSDDSTIKLLYGESYFAPSTYNMYAHYGAFTATDSSNNNRPKSFYFRLPNSGLQPEKSRTLELNVLQDFGKATLVTFSAYYTRATNLIFPVYNPNSVTFAGGTVAGSDQNQNVGSASFYGGYAQVNYVGQMGDFKLEPWLNYTYSDGTIDMGNGMNTPLPYNNKNTVKGGMTVRQGAFSLTPKFQALSPANHYYSDQTFPTLVPGYMLWDLTARAENLFTKDLDLTLDVRNLLDRRYFRPGTTDFTTFANSPQDSRTVMFMASYRL